MAGVKGEALSCESAFSTHPVAQNMFPIAYPKVVSDLGRGLVQVDNVGHEMLLCREAYRKISRLSIHEIVL